MKKTILDGLIKQWAKNVTAHKKGKVLVAEKLTGVPYRAKANIKRR